MHNALIGLVVGVGEEDIPVTGQGLGVNSEAVVLAGDEAAVCALVDTRLVVASVTIPAKRKGVDCVLVLCHTWLVKDVNIV